MSTKPERFFTPYEGISEMNETIDLNYPSLPLHLFCLHLFKVSSLSSDTLSSLCIYHSRACVLSSFGMWSRHWKPLDPRAELELNLHPQRFFFPCENRQIPMVQGPGSREGVAKSECFLQEILSYQLWLVCWSIIIKKFDALQAWGWLIGLPFSYILRSVVECATESLFC